MSNYDYSTAKLVMIFSSQYDDKQYLNVDALISSITKTSANGYILIPKSYTEKQQNSNEPPKHIDYTIKKMIEDSTTMENVTDRLHYVIKKITQNVPNANIWIGLPEIDIDCYPKSLDADNEKCHNYSADHYSNIMIFYIEQIKSKLEDALWEKNIRGFYFNQESIMSEDFNATNPSSAKDPEYRLLANLNLYIHGSTPKYLPYSEKKDLIAHTPVEINKDLIWMPYFVAYSKESNVEELVERAYTRIANLVENKIIFDAAMIQAHLISIHGELEYNENYTDPQFANNEFFKAALKRGIGNIAAISLAMEKGEFVYPDTGEPIVTNKNTAATGKCKIGAVYELNGTHEFNENDPTFKLGEASLYKPYRIYDNFTEYHPQAFYWQATSKSILSYVIDAIEQSYNCNERFSPKDHTVTKSSTCYTDAFSTSIFDDCFSTLQDKLKQPTSNSIVFNFSRYELPTYGADVIANTIKEVFIADNPDLFWIKDLNYKITYKDGYIDTITYTATMRSDNEEGNISMFEKFIKYILEMINNFLDDGISTMSSDVNEENFIKIYNWLVNNVTYTDSTQNIYYDCAFGAISTDIRKANSKGFSEALSVLCHKVNIPCLVMKGYKNTSKHYWNFVKLNNNWWFVDASLSVPTSSDPYKYKYFLREMPASYMCSECYPVISQAKGSYINYGDVNNNGVIDSTDAAMVEQKALNPSYVLGLIGNIAADVDCDGNITKDDSNHILQKVLKSTYLMPIETKIKEDYI